MTAMTASGLRPTAVAVGADPPAQQPPPPSPRCGPAGKGRQLWQHPHPPPQGCLGREHPSYGVLYIDCTHSLTELTENAMKVTPSCCFFSFYTPRSSSNLNRDLWQLQQQLEQIHGLYLRLYLLKWNKCYCSSNHRVWLVSLSSSLSKETTRGKRSK